jgi:putative inorganic carbon (hco3(-)) transporter
MTSATTHDPASIVPPSQPVQLGGVRRVIAPALPFAFLGGGGFVAVVLGFLVPDLGILLVAGLIGGVLAIISFLRPEIGLFLFTLMLYTRASENLTVAFGVPSVAPLFAVMMLSGLVAREGLGSLFRTRMAYWIPPALYGFVLLASVFVALDEARVISTSITYIRELIFVAVVVLYARTIRDTRIIIWALLLAGVVPALLTIYQTMSGSEFTFFGFGQYSAQVVVPGEIETVPRPAGHVGDPNFFALALVPLVPLALHRARYERSLFMRQLAVLAGVIVGTATVLTYSRGAYVALAVMFVAAVVAGFIRVKTLVIAGTILLVLFPILPASYTGRLTSLIEMGVAVVRANDGAPGVSATDTSVSGRRSQLYAGMEMFFDNPVLGVGAQNAALHYQEYARDVGIRHRTDRHLHSLYLEVAAETGLLGLTTFWVLIGSLVVWLRRVWVSVSQPPELRDLGRAFAVALIGFLVCSIFLHSAYSRFMWMLFAGIIATAVVADDRHKLRPMFRMAPVRRVVPLAFGSAVHRSRLLGTAAVLALAFVVTIGIADAAMRGSGVALIPLPEQPGTGGYLQTGGTPPNFPAVSNPGSGHANATPTPTPSVPATPTPQAPEIDLAARSVLLEAVAPAPPLQDCEFFAITSHNLCWPFASYWNTNGGLSFFGYPLTEAFDTDGVTTQYFERARLEWHPARDGLISQVIAAPLGRLALLREHGVEVLPAALPGDDVLCIFEDDTQHNVCGEFFLFWVNNGSVTRFGLPITEEIRTDDMVIQYFEYGRLERVTDGPLAGQIMIGRLGAEELERMLGGNQSP